MKWEVNGFLSLPILVLFFAAIYGWVANIVKIVEALQHYNPDMLGVLIARVAGVPLVLLGSVLGFI